MTNERSAEERVRVAHSGEAVKRVRLDGIDQIRFERSVETRVEIRSTSLDGLDAVDVIIDGGTLTLKHREQPSVELPRGAVIGHVGSMTIGPEGVVMDGVKVIHGRSTITGDNHGIVVGGDLIVHGDQNFDFSGGRVRMTTSGKVEVRGTVAGFLAHAEYVVAICQPECPTIRLSGSTSASLHDVQQDALEIDVSGAASVRGSGNVSELRLEASGASTARLHKLTCAQARVEISGSAKASVAPIERVRGDVSGVARLILKSEPAKCDITTSGLGKISRRGTE